MTTRPPDGPRTVGAPLVIFVAFTVQALVCIGLFSLPVAAPFAAPTLGLSASLVGVQVGLLYVSAIASSLLAARVTQRFGGIRTSQISLVGTALGLWLCATGTLSLVVAGTVVMGIAFGLPNPAASELLQRHTDAARRNLSYSIKQAGVPFGGILATVVVGLVGPYSWQVALCGLGALSAVSAVAIQPLAAPLDATRTAGISLFSNPFGSISTILAAPVQRRFFVVSLLLAACQLSVATFGMQMLLGDFHLATAVAAGIVALTQGAGFIGRLSGGVLGDRFGAIGSIGGLCVVMVISAIALATSGSSTEAIVLAVLFFLVGATSSGWSGLLLSEADHRAPPGMAADAAGVLMLASFVGVVLSSTAFGFIVPLVHSVRVVFWFVALAAALSLATLYLVLAADRHRAQGVEK